MPDSLKTTIERNVRAIELRPGVGIGTATTVVTAAGMKCEAIDGRWTVTAGAEPSNGGDGTAPDPGVFVRAALGACLAQGYVMWAARLGVPIARVEVLVETDYDARGIYGIDGHDAGWRAVRYVTTIESTASREQIADLVEQADAHSPILDDLRRPLSVERELRIVEA